MELKLNVKYDIKWPKKLINKRTQDMVDSMGREVVRGIKRNIMTSMAVVGGKFRRLKPDTVRRKKGMRYPSKPLYALGMLYRSIHYYSGHRTNRGVVGIARRGKPLRRDVAAWQQFGTYEGGIARRFFGLSRELRQKLRAMSNSWIRETIRRADSYKKGKF